LNKNTDKVPILLITPPFFLNEIEQNFIKENYELFTFYDVVPYNSKIMKKCGLIYLNNVPIISKEQNYCYEKLCKMPIILYGFNKIMNKNDFEKLFYVFF